MTWLKARLCLLPFFLISLLLIPVSGNRFLWQDEIETAERARSILYYGVPRTIDPEGRVSVNAGGREIEEGTLHRYTPWGQFYIGAVGLGAGRLVGANADASLRVPFILLHAATSSALAYGLISIGAWPVAAAVGASTLWGVGTVRLLHNRTARYHSALDFLFVIGLLAIGFLKQNPRSRAWAFALGAATFLLPQMHTLGGSLLSSTLVLLAFLALSEGRFALMVITARSLLWCAILPALASVVVICILCRPWAQSAWAHGAAPPFSSLRSASEIAFGFYVLLVGLILLATARRFRELLILLSVCLYILIVVRVLDLHPFSQTRYYLSVPLFLTFGFLALRVCFDDKIRRLVLIASVFLAALLPDIQGLFPVAQGLRIVVSDYVRVRSELQPVGEALQLIRSGGATAPVLIDYVPQYVNWYLPQNPVALMPDQTSKTNLNLSNRAWWIGPQFPEWQLKYASQNGLWTCAPECDFRATDVVNQRYELSSKRMGSTEEMCVVKTWATSHVNNAPFIEYFGDSTTPEGLKDDTLILSRRCAKAQ